MNPILIILAGAGIAALMDRKQDAAPAVASPSADGPQQEAAAVGASERIIERHYIHRDRPRRRARKNRQASSASHGPDPVDGENESAPPSDSAVSGGDHQENGE